MPIVNKPQLYMLMGLPGSGKDTLLKYKKNLGLSLCRDTVRAELGIKGDKPMGTKEQENKVTKIIESRFNEYCEANINIVINNTNLKRKYRLPFVNKAKEHGYLVVIIFLNAPLQKCIERRQGQISKEVIERMWKDFEFPLRDEYDYITIIDTEEDNLDNNQFKFRKETKDKIELYTGKSIKEIQEEPLKDGVKIAQVRWYQKILKLFNK